MTKELSIYSIHSRIVSEQFLSQSLTDTDFFLLFCLLHCYSLKLSPTCFIDEQLKTREISGLTQRGASEELKILWNLQNSCNETKYVDWYWKWNTEWNGYVHFENLSLVERARLSVLKTMFESSELVEELVLAEAK
ncbi:MAG: hypothetical protein K2Y39_17260 [Candidatus Obscuribacterales bacterium]|nr:hypothetical protein [Candidatus Obscuribacterales bacterium]